MTQQIEKSAIPLTVTNQEGVIVYANPAMERRTGFAVRQMIGNSPSQLWGGHMSRPYYDKLWEAMLKGRRFSTVFKNKHRHGSVREDAMCLVPFAMDGRRHFMAIGNHHGIVAERMPLDQLLEAEVTVSILEDCLAQYERMRHDRASDAALLYEAKLSKQAFGAIYEKYHDQVLQYFLRRVGDDAIAEDLTHDVFVKAFGNLSTFEVRNANYLTYLLRIAHNHLVNYYRSQKMHISCDECKELEAPSRVEAHHTKIDVAQQMGELTTHEQRLLQLKYHQGYKMHEIAERLGKSVNAVKLQFSRLRKKIKKNIR